MNRGHNGDLNLVTWEQRAMGGDPRFEDSQLLPDFDYAQYARMLGLNGIRVDRAEDIADAWEDAIAADRPTVLEMMTDPEVPPLPPHIPVRQMKAYLKAMRDDPASGSALRATLRQWWAS